VTDLGTLPGGSESGATGINDLGLIVGSADDASGVGHATTWSRTGTIGELPELPGGSNSEALAVSDTGFIVGDGTDAAGNDVAIRWY
jgi:probable HAF family extracellular repeat protein